MERSELLRWPERYALCGETLANAWAEWLGAVHWQLFVVLTFDPSRVSAVSSKLANLETFWWCTQSAKVLRVPLGWLYAVERHRSGRHHAHVLMVGVPDDDLGPAPAAMWRQRNGHIDIRPVFEPRGAVLYSTKEAAASGEVVVADTMKRYLTTGQGGERVRLHGGVLR